MFRLFALMTSASHPTYPPNTIVFEKKRGAWTCLHQITETECYFCTEAQLHKNAASSTDREYHEFLLGLLEQFVEDFPDQDIIVSHLD